MIVCTRNRAARLDRLLGSACDLKVPAGAGWELIVVDNGSSDSTSEVVAGFAGRLPLRRIEEPVAGVCRARNRGIDDAGGAYICWADDDVLLDRDWLAAYLAAFRRHPEAAIFGGPIHPFLEEPSREPFRRCSTCWPLAGAYAHRDFGRTDTPISIADGIVPWGANMAIRTDALLGCRFNPSLGPSPASNRLGDESDLIFRLMKDGATGWWVPDAGVRHVIGHERQTLSYVISYYRRSGETAAFLHDRFPADNALEVQQPPSFATLATPTLRGRILLHLLRALAARAAGRPCSWLGHLANCGYDMGVVDYRRASARMQDEPQAGRRLG